MGDNRITDVLLRETVTAFLRAGKSKRKAAAVIGISRHTMRNRLKLAQERGLYSGAVNHAEEPIKDQIVTDLRKNSGFITTKSLHIQTLPEALTAANVDLDVWEVERHLINSWEVTMGATIAHSDKPETFTNWQVKVWLKKKASEPALKAIELLVRSIPTFKQVGPKPIHLSKAEYLQEMAPFDVHFGKLAWGEETGQGDYDISIAGAKFLASIEKNLHFGSAFPLSKILYILGQDLMHVENYMNQTALGGNNLDVDTRLPKIFEAAMAATLKTIYMCRTVAPVEVIWIPGNHDMHASYYMSHAIKQHFRKDKFVTVDNGPAWRKARTWGNLLVGFMHDAERKQASAINLLPQFWPDLWGKSKYRELHTGHLHKKGEMKYLPTQTVGGTIIRRLPTLSVIDKWHYDNLFVDAVPGGESMIWSKEHGVVAHFTAYVD